MVYVALLRGINVGGNNKIKMADLKLVLTQLGLSSVRTYIQSGNVIFDVEESSKSQLEHLIANGIKEHFKIDVPVIVKTREELVVIIENNPFTDSNDLESNKVYFVMLKNLPEPKHIDIMNGFGFENETFLYTTGCVYLRCGLGAGKAKCNNNFFESKLKVVATTRNYRTLTKLIELSIN